MIVGVSHPIHSTDAAFAMLSGTADADYPVANLADPKEITEVFVASASGAIAFKATLAADQTVEFVALCCHNATDGATYRIRSYSDTGASVLVDDSGTLGFAIDASSPFGRTVTPYRLPSAMTVRAVRIDLSDIGLAWQIGALIVSGFWDLSAHDARSLGIKPKDGFTDVGDGVRHGTRQWSPRVFTLGNRLIDWTTEGRTFHDFQRDMKLAEPFVWVRDYGDASTWVRECAVVRNQSRPTMGKDAYIFGSFALDMIEHLGVE